MTTQQRIHLMLALILGVGIFTLIALSLAAPDTAAQGPVLPTPTNVPSGGDGDDDDDGGDRQPVGAYIELQVQPAKIGLWSVVQWQDSAGGWHDVEGWRGPVAADGYRRWWVAAKDFNTGPFRWVVKEGANEPIIAVSDSFSLPGQANSTLRISVPRNP